MDNHQGPVALHARHRHMVAIATCAVVLGLFGAGPALAVGSTPQAAPTDATATWGTSPTDNTVGTGRPNYSYNAEVGGSLRDAVDIVNRGTSPIELRVYASDAFTTPSGGIDLLPAAEVPTGVGSWITMEQSTVTVPAGATVTVPFTLEVPADATPGDHTGGIVTSLITEASNAPVSVDRRIGSRVYIRVEGELKPELAITDVRTEYSGTLNPLAAGTAEVTYTVSNTGNVRLQADQAITIAGPFGLLSTQLVPDDLPELLPGNSLTLTVALPGVWPTGRIITEVQLAPFASQGDPLVSVAPAAGSGSQWALPVGQLLVPVLIAALVIAMILFRRRRAAAVEAAIASAVAQALEAAETSTP